MNEAEVVHHIAGRMRVRVPAAKGDSELLREILGSIRKVPGVLEVTGNPGLGTLVIHYDPALSGEAVQRITEHGSKARLFLLRPPDKKEDDPPVSGTDRALDQLFTKVNRTIQAGTGQGFNLKEAFPFGILVYAMLFVDKAIAASEWLNWVQFAISTYLELHDSEPVAKVGDSVESLRGEVRALHEELRNHLEKQK